mgnify:CR=1 FL=1
MMGIFSFLKIKNKMFLYLKRGLVILVSFFLMGCNYLFSYTQSLNCQLVDISKDANKELIFEGQSGILTLKMSKKNIMWMSDIGSETIIFSENFMSSKDTISAQNSFYLDWTDGTKQKILRTISIDRANLLMAFTYTNNETNSKKNLAERGYQCSLADNKI